MSKTVVAEQTVVADVITVALVDTLRALRDVQKELAKQEAEVRADILKALNGATQAITPTGELVCELVEDSRRSADLAILEDLFPEAYDATVKTTTYNKLNLPKIK